MKWQARRRQALDHRDPKARFARDACRDNAHAADGIERRMTPPQMNCRCLIQSGEAHALLILPTMMGTRVMS